MSWKTLLAYITGTVDQELLLRNAYLVTENRILCDHIKGRLRWHDGERKALADIGQKLGKQALAEVAKIVKPDTILSWQRRFVAQKFDGSQKRKSPGRPTIDKEVEALVVRMVQENRSWGYDRIVGRMVKIFQLAFLLEVTPPTWLGKEVISLPPPPRRTGRATRAAPSSSSPSKVPGLRLHTVDQRCSRVTFTPRGIELFLWMSALLLVVSTRHPATSAPFRVGYCPIRQVMDSLCLSAVGIRFLTVLYPLGVGPLLR